MIVKTRGGGGGGGGGLETVTFISSFLIEVCGVQRRDVVTLFTQFSGEGGGEAVA